MPPSWNFPRAVLHVPCRPRGLTLYRPLGSGRTHTQCTPTDGYGDCPSISEAWHRRRPGGPGRYSATVPRACRATPMRATRGAAAPETNRKKEPGVDARPVFALSVQPTAAMNPRTGGRRGSKVPGAPSMKINAKPPQKRTPGPFFPPISLGRNGGARRAGAPPGAPRCENVEPLIRPSVRTGTPSPQRGEGRAVDKPSSRRIRREE